MADGEALPHWRAKTNFSVQSDRVAVKPRRLTGDEARQRLVTKLFGTTYFLSKYNKLISAFNVGGKNSKSIASYNLATFCKFSLAKTSHVVHCQVISFVRC